MVLGGSRARCPQLPSSVRVIQSIELSPDAVWSFVLFVSRRSDKVVNVWRRHKDVSNINAVIPRLMPFDVYSSSGDNRLRFWGAP